jgi:hypothetical protein
MPAPRRDEPDDVDIRYTVDDETFDELADLAGERVAGIGVWEDSIAQALGEGEMTDSAVDLDVYLDCGVYFELYGVLCYPDLDSDPLAGTAAIDQHLAALVSQGIMLVEIAVDDEDSLVLVLGADNNPMIYLNSGAWSLDEWEELPDTVHTS